MLHYVQHLLDSFFFLLFGAEKIVYSGVLDLFDRKQLPTGTENDADESRKCVSELKRLSCGRKTKAIS